jgi:hypothetical protein
MKLRPFFGFKFVLNGKSEGLFSVKIKGWKIWNLKLVLIFHTQVYKERMSTTNKTRNPLFVKLRYSNKALEVHEL